MCNEPSEGWRRLPGADKFIIPVSREVKPENDESIILKRQVRRRSPDYWGCGFAAGFYAAVTGEMRWSDRRIADLPHRCLVCGGGDSGCCVCRCFSAARRAHREELGGGDVKGVEGEGKYQYSMRALSKKQLLSRGSVGRSASQRAALHGC